MINISLFDVLGLIGLLSIGGALFVLGRLSRRLGKVTQARSYYHGLYVAAFLLWLGAICRIFFWFNLVDQAALYVLVCDGLPALGLTLGLAVTWYYWSWLLAERD